MCELLLKYGRNHTSNYNINTEKINTLGDTLLHRAVRSGNIKIVELLLKNGADVNATDIDGYTPLHTVFYIDCERLPCKDKEKNDLLLNLCKLLIDNGADVNATDKNGKKPLDLARTDEIKQLLLGRSKL
jgi:ankyrin repeat protein